MNEKLPITAADFYEEERNAEKVNEQITLIAKSGVSENFDSSDNTSYP
jgi:hypothetical protein